MPRIRLTVPVQNAELFSKRAANRLKLCEIGAHKRNAAAIKKMLVHKRHRKIGVYERFGSKHRAEIGKGAADIAEIEKDKADIHHKDQIDMPDKGRQTFKRFAKHPFKRDEGTVVQTPKDKIPAGTVPKAC